MSKTAEAILDCAEDIIRARGYGACSFRDIAAHIGIKSASVHYHFPTKAHLGLAVASRYRAQFAAALDAIDASHPSPGDRLAAFVDIYRREMSSGSHRMSICMMLAAEMEALPEEIRACVTAFYHTQMDWLGTVLTRLTGADETGASRRARQVLALLQGAMLGAKTLRDLDYFEDAIRGIDGLVAKVAPGAIRAG